MKTLTFGNGDQMPILGLGTWKSAPGEVYTAVKEALKMGYRHIDCAAIYGNEKEVGKALRESFQEGTVQRKDLWITSKLWNNAHGEENVIPALKKTLADLDLEYLDLYEVHWPIPIKKEVVVPKKPEDFAFDQYPVSDTWKGMEKAQEEGLTRHIGVSNFSAKKLGALMDGARVKPEMNQVEIHAYMQQNELVDFCKAHDIHVTAYAPLGSSDRPAVLKAKDEPVLLEDPTIREIANEKGCSVAQVLLAWTIHRGIAVIPKSVNPGRMKENLEAAELQLSEADMQKISKINKDRRYVDGSMWVMEGGPISLSNLWDE